MFATPKPRVSKEEFREMLSVLAGKNFTQLERDKIRTIFLGDMEESDWQAGIDRDEAARTIKWLRANKSKHNLSEAKIAVLEQELNQRL